MAATICYRIAEAGERSQNRAEQGILIAKDLKEHIVKHDVQRGLMDEYVGDLLVLSGMDGVENAYSAANERYARTNKDSSWQAEPEFEMNIAFVLELARATNQDIGDEERKALTSGELASRPRYKQSHFSKIIEQVVDQESWTE